MAQIPDGPLAGLSLSFCVKDIICGKVEIDRVVRVVAGTFFTDRDMFHTGMKHSYCQTYWRDDPDRALEIAMQLWDEGKLDQPRRRLEQPPNIAHGHWISAYQLAAERVAT